MNWFVLVLVVLLVLENVQTGWVVEDEDENEEEDECPVSWEILMFLFDRTFAPQTAAGRTLPRQCLGARQSSAVIGSAQRARRRNLALLFSDRSAKAPEGWRSPKTGGISDGVMENLSLISPPFQRPPDPRRCIARRQSGGSGRR